jgi:hypothetical protein
MGRSMSRRDRFVKAITNPDSIFRHDPGSPPPESKYVLLSTRSDRKKWLKISMYRFNPNPNGKLIRTFFSNSLDVAPSNPAAPPRSLTPLLEADVPIFDSELISERVSSDLPNGYTLRPLCRSDYKRGFMDVARVVGKTGFVEEDVWDARCEWLERNKDTHFVLVVLDLDDMVVASGTLLFERKLCVSPKSLQFA